MHLHRPRAARAFAFAALLGLLALGVTSGRPQAPFASLPEGAMARRLLSGRQGAGLTPLASGTAVLVRPAPGKRLEWLFGGKQDDAAGRYTPMEYRSDTWYGSTYWGGPDWTRVGKDWHHPGAANASVRRLTLPVGGRITVSGPVRKADLNGGDGIRAEIRLNARTVWSADIAYNDPVGVDPGLVLEVRPGDALRFVVLKRGDIPCDTTYWDPVVTLPDGSRLQASAAFEAGKQGAQGWSYEMERADAAGPAGHALCGIRADSSPLILRLQPTGRAALPADALPVAVLADADDTGGVAVAMAAPGPVDAELTADGAVRLRAGCSATVLAAYKGPSANGFRALDEALRDPSCTAPMAGLRRALHQACSRMGVAAAPGSGSLELGLWWLVAADWLREDGLGASAEAPAQPRSFTMAARTHLEGAWRLMADLTRSANLRLDAQRAQWRSMAPLSLRPDLTEAQARSLYFRVRWLKRRVALANPLLPRTPILFNKRVPPSYSHLVMQYYGWRARAGGGLFLLDRPGYSLQSRDLLGGRLAHGSVLEPRLSYDAKRVVFSWVDCRAAEPDPSTLDVESPEERSYHVYETDLKGGLRQITRGPFDDLMPNYLPDGGIAFSSTRRGGYSRCFGAGFSKRTHVYTLHRVQPDGSGLRLLSMHDTNEWFPTTGHDGQIVYARWDYIDRDAVTHQNLWTTRPDGTAPANFWGNATPSPHCSFQAQPIPGTRKWVFTASAHHSMTAGSIVVLDPTKGENGHKPLTRITPTVPFPEAETNDIREYYCSPWPLSERYFLVAYSPYPLVWEPGANRPDALGIYLLDAHGNRELLYRDPEIGAVTPIPLHPRPCPPAAASTLPKSSPETGEVMLQDVYRGLPGIPRGTVKQLRVVQIFPKTTNIADAPAVGLAGEENARAVLGTVPVEADGSARFTVPAMKPILFQALDADGSAVQTMRSLTYLQRGERISCVGCHEGRSEGGRVAPNSVLAMRRAPSKLLAGPRDGRPYSYMASVQPVLNRRCVSCHGPNSGTLDLTGTPRGAFSASYWSLCGGRTFDGGATNLRNAAQALVPRFGARNQVQVTPPGGAYGARGSRLMRLLASGHHGITLADEERRALAEWIDLNALFYGVYAPEEQARQMRGESAAMPTLQ